jgi:hypothetical protein
MLVLLTGLGFVSYAQIVPEGRSVSEKSTNLSEEPKGPVGPEGSGEKEVSRGTDEGKEAVPAAADPGKVRRLIGEIRSTMTSDNPVMAFHDAAYGRGFSTNEMREAFRVFLNDPNPEVRFTAAQYLYVTGDGAGRETLAAFVRGSPMPTPDGIDLRTYAAELLTKYRDKGTLSDLTALYKKTQDAALLNSIMRMMGKETPAELLVPPSGGWSPMNLFDLALADSSVALDLARSNFDNPGGRYAAQQQNASAWILLQNGMTDPYWGHLVDQAHKAMNGEYPQGRNHSQYTDALKYLASVDMPQTRGILESALASKDRMVVEIAAVNLLFNQTGSSKPVKELLLSEFNPENFKSYKLNDDLKWQLATVMINDPDISRAAHAYSDWTRALLWEHYIVERRQWPIYNWVDNYAAKLNREKPE